MKKTKLLIALAMVVATLSFGFKAKAQVQGEVPIYLTYLANDFNAYRFEIMLFNNDTQEPYVLYTNSSRMEDDDTFRCGYVPTGNYTVSIRLWTGNEGRFNWWAKNESGTNVLLDYGHFYELLSTVNINDDVYNNDVGLHLTVQDW